MNSNRIYDWRHCDNPDCRVRFQPHDRRMKFCSTQCRSNFHNDRRRETELTRYGMDRDRRQADRLLEGLFRIKDPDSFISEKVLETLGLNFDAGTWEKNLDTGGFIRWFYSYGLELAAEGAPFYTIHLRTKTHSYD